MQTLADLLKMKGCMDEAEGLYRDAVKAQREELGDAHPATVTSQENLNSFLKEKEQKEKEKEKEKEKDVQAGEKEKEKEKGGEGAKDDHNDARGAGK